MSISRDYTHTHAPVTTTTATITATANNGNIMNGDNTRQEVRLTTILHSYRRETEATIRLEKCILCDVAGVRQTQKAVRLLVCF